MKSQMRPERPNPNLSLASRFGRVAFAAEQALGTPSAQQDRVRVEVVRIRGGHPIILAVVADGERHARAGEAADMVLQKVFQAVAESRGQDLTGALRQGLRAGGEALVEVGARWAPHGRVAATALAIRGNRLYLASVGHGGVYRVRAGKTTLLNHPEPVLLGGTGQPEVWIGEREGLALRPGDQIVLATDGLTQISPEDNRPYVNPGDFAGYLEGNKALEAARHLVSIALGRDVGDNVSVVVLQVAGKQGGLSLRPLAGLLIVAAAVVAGGWLAYRWWQGRSVAPPPDFGYAVVVRGSVRVRLADAGDDSGQAVGELGTIPAGGHLTASEDTRLALQTTYSGPIDLSPLSFYLVSGTALDLTRLDSHPDPLVRGQEDLSGTTALTLESGQVLMVRGSGGWGSQIHAQDTISGFAGPGAAALGVSLTSQGLVVDCLRGQCSLQAQVSPPLLFGAGQQASVEGATPVVRGAIPADASQAWDTLCGGCLEAMH
jgi:serine/threonine protein phosphatase PrpC